MGAYIIIGIILVVIVSRLFPVNNKKKQATFSNVQLQAARKEIEERKFESDNLTESSYSDVLHWTIEQEARRAKEIEDSTGFTALSNESQEVLNKVLALPHDFKTFGNKSQNQLVIESGYCEIHEQITARVIAEALALQPQRTREWLGYSKDQRTSEGWFLSNDANRYVVGTFTTKAGYKKSLTEYPDLESACAAFIKRKMEYSRLSTTITRSSGSLIRRR